MIGSGPLEDRKVAGRIAACHLFSHASRAPVHAVSAHGRVEANLPALWTGRLGLFQRSYRRRRPPVDNVAQSLIAQLIEAGLTAKAPSRGETHADRPFGNSWCRSADIGCVLLDPVASNGDALIGASLVLAQCECRASVRGPHETPRDEARNTTNKFFDLSFTLFETGGELLGAIARV